MPRTQLPISNGYYEVDSEPVSAQKAINVYPVVEEADSLVPEYLMGCPGVRTVSLTLPEVREECLPYSCSALEDKWEEYFSVGVPAMAGPLTGTIPWVGDEFTDVLVATQSASTLNWMEFTDFTNGGFGPGSFGIRPVDSDATGWSLCAGTVEEGFAVLTDSTSFNAAGIYVPGRFNSDAAVGVIGLGESQSLAYEGGTVYEVRLYVQGSYVKLGAPETTNGNAAAWLKVYWDTSEYVLEIQIGSWSDTLSLPSGVFPTPSSNTIGFMPWAATIDFNNYRWDSSGTNHTMVCDADYRIVVDGNELSGTRTGVELGSIVKVGVDSLSGIDAVDPTVAVGVPENVGGGSRPFAYAPNGFYTKFDGYIGYFVLGGTRTIPLEDITAFETAFSRNFSDYTPPGDCP